MMIVYRILDTMPELEQIVSLQLTVWGLNPRNAVPAALLHVLALNGGLVLGAYEDDLMVGLLICLPSVHKDERYIWSHMAGVHPQHQGKGIGVGLKQFQRTWALEQGYKVIKWTADPLQRGNAHFNLRLLGETACMYFNTYHVNFYGDMDDDINRGMPSDRIEYVWQLDQPSLHQPITSDAPLVLTSDERNYPVLKLPSWDEPVVKVGVPPELDALRKRDRQAVLDWRLALRQALQEAFAHGYRSADFVSSPDCSYYILTRTSEKPAANSTTAGEKQ